MDVTGSLDLLGKQTGSDAKNQKATYVTLKGIEQAKKDVECLSEEAIGIVSSFKERNGFLEALIKRLVTRQK